MSFKNLPSSLINSVVDVLTQSNSNEQTIISSVMTEGLSIFGVSSVDELTETERKEFYSWAQKEIESRKTPQVSYKEPVVSEDTTSTIQETQIDENVAVAPDELAANGAVGVRSNTKTPVHADVLAETTPTEGKTEYRLLVQFPTNERCVIVPPVTLPGAPTVEALKTVVEGLPYYSKVIEEALAAAVNLPHTQPQFSGNKEADK